MCSPSSIKILVKLQMAKKKRPIHPEILRSEVRSSKQVPLAADGKLIPQSAPRDVLTETRSWANATSKRDHQYRNGHQACTSCCLLHCLSSAGA